MLMMIMLIMRLRKLSSEAGITSSQRDLRDKLQDWNKKVEIFEGEKVWVKPFIAIKLIIRLK